MNLFLILITFMFLAGTFTITLSLFGFSRFIQIKDRNINLIAINWLFWGLSWFVFGFGNYHQNQTYFTFARILQIMGAFFFLFFAEYNANLSVSSLKITILTFISGLFIYYSLQSNMTEFNDDIGFIILNELKILQMTFGVFYFYINIEWVLKIYKNHPKQTNGKFLLYSVIIRDIIPMFLYIFTYFFTMMYYLVMSVHAMGILLFLIVLKNEPHIINIIPLKAHRILILNRKTKKICFEYNWSNKEFEEGLIGGLLKGIINVGDNVLFSGNIEELRLKEIVIIFNHKENFSYAVIANESTSHLIQSLENFSKAFERLSIINEIKEQERATIEDFLEIQPLFEKYFASIRN